jgi:hypothetical protein
MRLYGTITSERATKGQGGNDYLDIDITVGSRDKQFNLAKLTVRVGDREGVEVYGLYDEGDNLLASIPTDLSRSKYNEFDCGCEKDKFSCLNHSKDKRAEEQKCSNCGKMSTDTKPYVNYFGINGRLCVKCSKLNQNHSKAKRQKGECPVCGETGGKHSDDACEPYKG